MKIKFYEWMNAFSVYIIFGEFSVCSQTQRNCWHCQLDINDILSNVPVFTSTMPCNSCCVCVQMWTKIKIKMLIQQYVLLIIFVVNDFMLPHCDIHSVSAFNFPTVIALIEEWFRGKEWTIFVLEMKIADWKWHMNSMNQQPIHLWHLSIGFFSLSLGCCYFSHFKRPQAILFIHFICLSLQCKPLIEPPGNSIVYKNHICQ